MDWVVDETQIELMEEVTDKDLQSFCGYVTWCIENYYGNLFMGIRRPTDKQHWEVLEELGLVRGEMRDAEAHPALLCAFSFLLTSEAIVEVKVIQPQEAWEAMVEGIRCGTFNNS